jgi:hypothetical protein
VLTYDPRTVALLHYFFLLQIYSLFCSTLATDCLAEDQRKPFTDVYKRLCKVGLKAAAPENTKSSQNVSRDSSKSNQSAVGSPPKAQFSVSTVAYVVYHNSCC